MTTTPADGGGWPEPFASDYRLVNDCLQEELNSLSTLPDRLAEAIRYAVLAPGKRLRPILTLLAFDACGGGQATLVRHQAVRAGCAVEYVHAFSLVHDDLPALDNDDLRRGRPTLHRAFDEATAILAGDALLAKAFGTVNSLDHRIVPAEQTRCLVSKLATASGPSQLIGGQMRDLEAEGRWGVELAAQWHTRPGVQRIQMEKTAALLSASLAIGGVVAGADHLKISRLESFGRDIGLAFQIADDLLNEQGDPEVLGKAAGTDRARGKATVHGVAGIEAAEAMREELHQRALRSVGQVFPQHRERFATLAAFLAVRRT